MAHIDQLTPSVLFSAFKVHDSFIPKSKLRRDDGILKYNGRIQSNLVFLLYMKDAVASLLSDFKRIQGEPTEMMENVFSDDDI